MTLAGSLFTESEALDLAKIEANAASLQRLRAIMRRRMREALHIDRNIRALGVSLKLGPVRALIDSTDAQVKAALIKLRQNFPSGAVLTARDEADKEALRIIRDALALLSAAIDDINEHRAALAAAEAVPLPPAPSLFDRALAAYVPALEAALPVAPVRHEDSEIEVTREGRVQPYIALRLREPMDDDHLIAGLRGAMRRIEAESPEVARVFAFRVIDAASSQERRIPSDPEAQAMLAFRAGLERYADTYAALAR